ncbi:anaerobic C4-dicarboxylate transporter DcuA/anaerobic C4-dicarboxylate transporter DcuB [Tindallia magadiensis]|uniref:Anaerobic C4-dicarboxylate transporter DcuA/anaerobic C4-dicarboxylate transporter DcuB n=1 Tax=Tindallia magadiensis TaxID=69895 RepID=A0A1I3B2U4_9FIRM|nr:anaerobic C4-dicarboxylate transporter [Tindallia magadiensis]SFH56645.1 anaerobic C4-dicarboxylate transporter DcuA/anaerobic C4-dicarboxylate transporter DcuB [Tindallia magadiensis]
MYLQFAIVLLAIFIGARIGGVALGAMGGLGLAVLSFVFNMQPTSAPIAVMLMIFAVVTAAATLEATGGMSYLVKVAEKILRKNPGAITYMAPIVTYVFTVFAGTGHVAYSVLPVIAEVSREQKVRPERPLSIAVIASQQAIVASPISAATVALLGILSPYDITLNQILMVTIPATFAGIMISAFLIRNKGAELEDDPEYQKRLAKGLEAQSKNEEVVITSKAKISVLLFLLGTISIVFFGSFDQLRPVFEDGSVMGMATIIQVIMLSVAALNILVCKADVEKVASGGVFKAGSVAIVAIFGIAWLGDSFFSAHIDTIQPSIEGMVESAPWVFAFALFIMSILLNSQAATTAALMPVGLAIGISPMLLIAMFPAVNGYFFLPNYGPIIAAIGFDRTGTTKIGKYIFNHSFMIPGLLATVASLVIGFILSGILL